MRLVSPFRVVMFGLASGIAALGAIIAALNLQVTQEQAVYVSETLHDVQFETARDTRMEVGNWNDLVLRGFNMEIADASLGMFAVDDQGPSVVSTFAIGRPAVEVSSDGAWLALATPGSVTVPDRVRRIYASPQQEDVTVVLRQRHPDLPDFDLPSAAVVMEPGSYARVEIAPETIVRIRDGRSLSLTGSSPTPSLYATPERFLISLFGVAEIRRGKEMVATTEDESGAVYITGSTSGIFSLTWDADNGRHDLYFGQLGESSESPSAARPLRMTAAVKVFEAWRQPARVAFGRDVVDVSDIQTVRIRVDRQFTQNDDILGIFPYPPGYEVTTNCSMKQGEYQCEPLAYSLVVGQQDAPEVQLVARTAWLQVNGVNLAKSRWAQLPAGAQAALVACVTALITSVVATLGAIATSSQLPPATPPKG